MTAHASTAGERESFEAWRKRTTKMRPDDSVALDGFGDDAPYVNSYTQIAWRAWQARAALAATDSAKAPDGELEMRMGSWSVPDYAIGQREYDMGMVLNPSAPSFRLGWNAGFNYHYNATNAAPVSQAQSAAPAVEGLTEDEDAAVIEKLARLLAEIAITIKGDELPLHRHSYHDLPALVATMKLELDLYRSLFPNGVPSSVIEQAGLPMQAKDGGPNLDNPKIRAQIDAQRLGREKEQG